jgi:hypothetical protein
MLSLAEGYHMKKNISSASVTRISQAADGYLRLQFNAFCALPFEQRTLYADEELRDELLDEDLPVATAGYCEWTDDSCGAVVTVGWAWFTTEAFGTKYMAPGGVSSNVMLLSREGNDLGMLRTQELLTGWLVGKPWQIETPLAPRTAPAKRARI